MITNIQSIKKVGCYDSFTFDSKKLNKFQKVNIFYGNNGCGKTTLSNLFFLLSKNCKEKSNLFTELVENDSEFEIATDSGKVTHKNILEKNLDLYVFNSKFISDHVYNGTTSNVDAFSNDIKLTSPEIEKIDKKISTCKLRNEKLNRWNALITTKLDAIFKVYNEEFQTRISGSRLVNVKPSISDKKTGILANLKFELQNLYTEYSKKSKEASTIEKFSELKERINSIINIDVDIDELSVILFKKISSEAKGKVADKIAKYQNRISEKGQVYESAIGDLNDWYKKGGRLIHLSKEIENSCPLCDSDLSGSIDSIISDYSSYFSDSLVKLFDFLDSKIYSLESFVHDNHIVRNEDQINFIIGQCTTAFNFQIPPFNFSKNIQLKASISEVIEILRKKKQNPEFELSIELSVTDVITEYIKAIDEFKIAASDKIEKELNVLKGKNLEQIIRDIKAKIGLISSVELNEKVNSVFTSKAKTNSDIATICTKLININDKLNTQLVTEKNAEISKLNSESKYINIYLKHFGISNFEIDRDKVKTHDNLVITYKTGRKKTKLNHSLSEGEKTALAFAYFISKLRVEKIEGDPEGFKNTIIVIDDPISSLDDNRLFQTANLIDSFLFYSKEAASEHPLQLFVFSHNITFIKYLHNALRTNVLLKDKIEEYYLSNSIPKIRKLPSGLKNFTNTYIVKLKEIQDFKEGKIEYEIVKNYLPNYIRIVLETFLSFKLAMVNDDSNMLPGMSSLIKAITKTVEPFDSEQEIGGIKKDGAIKRLNHLKKIADHESHGSIYKAEEFAFISEDELKEFAKNTLQVIDYLDKIHLNRIKAHESVS